MNETWIRHVPVRTREDTYSVLVCSSQGDDVCRVVAATAEQCVRRAEMIIAASGQAARIEELEAAVRGAIGELEQHTMPDTTMCGFRCAREWTRLLRAMIDTAEPPREKKGIAAILGKWPGDETDEEVRQALEDLS